MIKTPEQEREKFARLEALKSRLSYIETLKSPYFKVFNSELFSLKIEVGFIDPQGEPATCTFFNHKRFGDMEGFEPIESRFFKFYLQEMFTKYQLEYMDTHKAIAKLKKEL
jgi:hypothetical protein